MFNQFYHKIYHIIVCFCCNKSNIILIIGKPKFTLLPLPLYALAIGKPKFTLLPLPLYALASLARGVSRAFEYHITKDTQKYTPTSSPIYPIILLFHCKIKSV